MAPKPITSEWERDCRHWRGRALTGKHAHWCPDWDYLPIDETTPEWPCVCCRSDPACAHDIADRNLAEQFVGIVRGVTFHE